MKSWLIKLSIIISIIVIISLSGYFIFNYFQNKKLAEINKQLEIREEKIKELKKEKDLWLTEKEKLKKKKVVTKIEYVKLPDVEKEKAYNELYDNYQIALKVIDDADKIIEEQGQIIQADEKIINDLKIMAKVKKFGIEPFIIAGLNERLKPEIFAGGQFKFNFLDNRISFGIGGYVKLYNEFGGGGIVSLGINF